MQNIIDTFQAQGTRKEQQDSFGQWVDTNKDFLAHGGSLVIVADGMGGLEQGKQASDLAIKSFIHAYKSKPSDESIDSALKRSVIHCNKAVYDFSSAQGLDGKLGTTIVAAVSISNMVHWISVGDSRIYQIKQDSITCLTKDHNYENDLLELVEKGELTIEEVNNNSQKAALTSYIGDKEIAKINSPKEPLKCAHGDKILLCSDGLYAHISDLEFIQTIKTTKINYAEALISLKLTKQLKKQDNLTASVITINTGADSKPKKARKILFIWLFLLSVSSFGIIFFLELGPFLPTPIVSEASSPRAYDGNPMLSSEDNQENIAESQAAEPEINPTISPIEDNSIKSKVLDGEQITNTLTQPPESKPAMDQSINETSKPIKNVEPIDPPEDELPYIVYPNAEETETTPAPKLENKVSQTEELVPYSSNIDDDVTLPVTKSSNAISEKSARDNEQELIPGESQPLILEQQIAPEVDCIETQFGCIKMPQPKKNNTPKETQDTTQPEANTRVTNCRPQGVAINSLNKILPECESEIKISL